MKRKQIAMVLGLFVHLVVLGAWGFADLAVNCGQSSHGRRCTISIADSTGQEVFWSSVDCQSCHKAPLPGGKDLQKSYDAKSKMNHVQIYAFSFSPNEIGQSQRYQVREGQKILWDPGIYLFREGGRLAVINEVENYKLLCESDAVIVKDRYGKPGMIITGSPAKRIAPLGPKDLTKPVRK